MIQLLFVHHGARAFTVTSLSLHFPNVSVYWVLCRACFFFFQSRQRKGQEMVAKNIARGVLISLVSGFIVFLLLFGMVDLLRSGTAADQQPTFLFLNMARLI
jgi:hypothetical protein